MGKLIAKKFFEEMTFFGGIAFYLFVIILLLIFEKLFFAFRLFLGLIIIYFIVFVIRLFYFKHRPKKIEHTNFLEKIDASSFPSVHAARITFLFLFAIFLSGPDVVIKLIAGLVFLLVLYSRIYLFKHDLIDILGGVVVGAFAMLVFIIPL